MTTRHPGMRPDVAAAEDRGYRQALADVRRRIIADPCPGWPPGDDHPRSCLVPISRHRITAILGDLEGDCSQEGRVTRRIREGTDD